MSIINNVEKAREAIKSLSGPLGDWLLTYEAETNCITIKYKDEVVYTSPKADEMEHKLIQAFNISFHKQFTSQGNRPLVAIVDFIINYYTLRIKTKFSNTILAETIKECERRFNNDNTYPFTDYLYNKLIDEGMNREDFAYGPNRFETFLHGSQPRFYYTRNITREYVNGEPVSAPAHMDLSSWGYIKVTIPAIDGQTREISSWVSVNETFVNINGKSYPTKFANKYFKICSCCGNKAPKLFMGQCTVCLKVDPALVQIRGYSERAPSFLKFKEGKYSKALFKTPLYLGVELELESDGRRGQEGLDKGLLFAAQTLGKHCIFKRDGSINNGFEIVSTAATLDVHKEEWKDFFAGIKEKSYLGARDNVGMHVHVSREPLSFLTQGKMTEFMNSEDNKTYLKAVAGRWSNSYARQEKNRTVTYPFLSSDHSERYNALNLRNKATVEFRIFASTTSYDEFIMRLEFCEAVASYCSPCQSDAPNLKDVTKWAWFAKYVMKNNQQWPLLAKFIKGL
jgi:hypothetical protein